MTFIKRILAWSISKSTYVIYPLLFLLIFLGALNIFQNLAYLRPSDGVKWVQEGNQLRVLDIDLDVETSFQVGDLLRAIDDLEIRTLDQYDEFLHSAPLGSKHLYYLSRDGTPYEPWVEIKGIADSRDISYYLFAVTGWVYLVFLYLMISQRLQFPGKKLLALFSFLVFLGFVFSPTERFNLLDWISFYLDQLGELLIPSAMIGFIISLAFENKRSQILAHFIHWIPSLTLLTMMLFWFPRAAEMDGAILFYFNRLQWAQALWGGALVLTSLWMLVTLLPKQNHSRRMALVWVVSWLPTVLVMWRSDVPFGLLLASIAPVIFPIFMVFRWSHKGDLYLGEIAKKALVYLIVIILLLVGYLVFIRVFQLLLGGKPRQEVQSLITILGILLAALSYAPLKLFSSAFVDRLIYGKRLESLKVLFDFSGLIRADTDMDQFLTTLLDRLKNAFPIESGAVFKAGVGPKVFQTVANSVSFPGLILTEVPPELLNGGMIRGQQVNALVIGRNQEAAFQPGDFIAPLRTAGNLRALISFRLKRDNGRLSPEELRLLKNLFNQCDVLMENMELYDSVNQKANSIMQLKEANENIIESSRIGILTMDDMGHADSCNSAFADLTGRSKEELIGRTFEQMFSEKSITNQRQVEASITQEGVFTNREGRELTLEIQKTPLKSKENEVYGTLYLVEDVKERQETQQKLMQQEKLASIGLLAAGVAHEINTPLTGITSYSQMLSGSSGLSEDQKELLDLIQGQSQRAANIVSSLLNFSRKEGIPKGPVNLADVLHQTLRFLGHQIQRAKVLVTVEEGEGSLFTEGYPNQLQQVFVNLIVNAMDAMPAGGQLKIRIEKFRDQVKMSFIDSGLGMEADTKDRIFDPFFTTKEVGKGTGLGLAVVYNIMQDHQGNIEVESELGKGTTFVLCFPYHATRQALVR